MGELTIYGPVSRGGEPLWLQKLKVRTVRWLPRPLKVSSCLMGLHVPPYDEFFEELGSIHIGGHCMVCHDSMDHVLTWIGDVWHFHSSNSPACLGARSEIVFAEIPFEVRVNAHLDYLLGEPPTVIELVDRSEPQTTSA
jgi:hypothetical protein